MINPISLGIPPISAYIDPGTLTLVIQVLIAGAIGGLFLIKGWWRRVKAFIGRFFRR